jgi:hypothetical protein
MIGWLVWWDWRGSDRWKRIGWDDGWCGGWGRKSIWRLGCVWRRNGDSDWVTRLRSVRYIGAAWNGLTIGKVTGACLHHSSLTVHKGSGRIGDLTNVATGRIPLAVRTRRFGRSNAGTGVRCRTVAGKGMRGDCGTNHCLKFST